LIRYVSRWASQSRVRLLPEPTHHI
jgi:hypothetical protein